jgi:uncharacterized protein (DUF934 family)
MQVIINKHLTDNIWTHLSDDAPIENGNITVSLARWQTDKTDLLKAPGKIGIRLNSTDDLAHLSEDLWHIDLVALEFAAFTDGRSFSQARLLRDRYQYKGEIRAIGHFMPDQAFYLQRVGVNSFELDSEDQLTATLNTLEDFSVCYQKGANA